MWCRGVPRLQPEESHGGAGGFDEEDGRCCGSPSGTRIVKTLSCAFGCGRRVRFERGFEQARRAQAVMNRRGRMTVAIAERLSSRPPETARASPRRFHLPSGPFANLGLRIDPKR